MAMVKCPSCGEMISDKATKCVHCGYELMTIEEKQHCTECGEELEEGTTVCPKCGCPVEVEEKHEESSPQRVEVTGVRVSKKSKKLICIGVIAAIIAIIAIVGIQQTQKSNAKKTYISNLKTATTVMLTGGADAEKCGNLIQSVWHNAIFKKKDSTTDAYTCPDGYFVTDFNKALGNLFADSDFTKKIDDIKTNQSLVQSLMKDLQNPPPEYEDAYRALSDFYNEYTKLTNLVVSPTGSLQSFSSDFSSADSGVSNSYSKMKLYIQE